MSSRDEENGIDGYSAIQDELGRRINGIGVLCGRYGFSKADG
jgi:hypothetical protein